MRQLSIQRAAVIILFGLLFALAARFPTDTDTWWHLRSAEYTLQNGIIYSDPFSFTKAGEPWINHSWGAQLVLYGFGLSPGIWACPCLWPYWQLWGCGTSIE